MTLELAPIVAMATTDPELRAAADRYNRRLWDLIRLKCAVETDREDNRRERERSWIDRFWFPPVIIPTADREQSIAATREELIRERARIAAAAPTWGHL